MGHSFQFGAAESPIVFQNIIDKVAVILVDLRSEVAWFARHKGIQSLEPVIQHPTYGSVHPSFKFAVQKGAMIYAQTPSLQVIQQLLKFQINQVPRLTIFVET
jgi:hypothetical protein